MWPLTSSSTQHDACRETGRACPASSWVVKELVHDQYGEYLTNKTSPRHRLPSRNKTASRGAPTSESAFFARIALNSHTQSRWSRQSRPSRPRQESCAGVHSCLCAPRSCARISPPALLPSTPFPTLQEIVDAIQASDDGSTAPPEAEVVGGTAGSRVIGTKLADEEPQKPSDLPNEMRHGDSHGNEPPGPMSSEDKHVREGRPWGRQGRHSLHCADLTLFLCTQLQFLSSQQQQKAMQYDRNHPGRAGRVGSIVGSALPTPALQKAACCAQRVFTRGMHFTPRCIPETLSVPPCAVVAAVPCHPSQVPGVQARVTRLSTLPRASAGTQGGEMCQWQGTCSNPLRYWM